MKEALCVAAFVATVFTIAFGATAVWHVMF